MACLALSPIVLKNGCKSNPQESLLEAGVFWSCSLKSGDRPGEELVTHFDRSLPEPDSFGVSIYSPLAVQGYSFTIFLGLLV